MRVRIARWVVVAAIAAGLVPALQAPANIASAAARSSCDELASPFDASRNAALIAAVARDDLKAVTTLIARGADVNANARIDDWFTPLITAVRCASPNIVALLIAHGSDVNLEVEDAASASHYALHAAALIFAAERGNAEIVRLLLDAGANADLQIIMLPVDSDDLSKAEAGGTPLLMASEANIVRMLLDHGADPNKTDWLGDSALMRAAQAGKADICEILLRHGADRSLRDSDNMSASDQARRWGHPEIARMIDEWQG